MNYRLCFLANLITELSRQLSLSATRDWSYIQTRVEHEGISFLTITLPTFSDGLERAIERGFAESSDFQAFARRSKGCLPKFLSGFTRKVFEDDGSLKPDACPDAIYSLRQISRYYKKALIDCSDERKASAELQYIRTDEELSYHEGRFDANTSLHLTRVASIVTRALCSSFDLKSLRGRHGPGATAEGLLRNGRNLIRSWPIRAEPFFPSSWHTIPNAGWLSKSRRPNLNRSVSSSTREESIETGSSSHTIASSSDGATKEDVKCIDRGDGRDWKLEYLRKGEEPPVRVVFVPKTLKTPRVIAIEPSHMQYMQQAILRWIVPTIERHPLTKRSVHFSDQSINRVSARDASIGRQYATIDLSEASDRVSLKLVQLLFRDSPLLLGAMEACRTETARTPSGKLIRLNKFASMGSALCFPVEALVFYILIQGAVHKMLGVRPTWKSIENISRYIHVYGDDIIVPCAWLKVVVEELEVFGLKVNSNKSFHKSHFRESCGGDYYNGYDVKPSYFRVDPTRLNARLTINELCSLSEHSNQLYLKGLWSSAQAIRDYVSKQIGRTVPVRSYDCSGIYFHSCFRNTYNRWDPRFQRLRSKAVVPRITVRSDDISNIARASIMAGLTNVGNHTSYDFVSSVRPRVLRRKLGWID